MMDFNQVAKDSRWVAAQEGGTMTNEQEINEVMDFAVNAIELISAILGKMTEKLEKLEKDGWARQALDLKRIADVLEARLPYPYIYTPPTPPTIQPFMPWPTTTGTDSGMGQNDRPGDGRV